MHVQAITKRSTSSVSLVALSCLLLLALLLASCGGGGEDEGATSQVEETQSSAGGMATMPAANFAQPTTAITPGSGQADSSDSEAEDLAARGATIYTNQGCDDCHGPSGEGVADKGSSLADIDIDEGTFENVLRTGASGELGSEHIFGPTAISPSGVSALYAYVQSLAAE